MATQKSTQATPAASVTSSTTKCEIIQLRECFSEADNHCQRAERAISAATASIVLMLSQPDSPAMRLRIKALCEIVEHQAHDCMNMVNAYAEECGANFVDPHREYNQSICAAALGEAQTIQAVQS